MALKRSPFAIELVRLPEGIRSQRSLLVAVGRHIDSGIYGGQSRNQMLPLASPATIEVSLAVTAA
jgi:hypothetical protein